MNEFKQTSFMGKRQTVARNTFITIIYYKLHYTFGELFSLIISFHEYLQFGGRSFTIGYVIILLLKT